MTESTVKPYSAWNLHTRIFHWINFSCIVLLSLLGLIMLNKGSIGISGTEASIGLKTLHVLVGYVFALNLLIRIVAGFVGEPRSRWRALLPGKHFMRDLQRYNESVKSGRPQTFVGHNPKGRVSVLVMLLLLAVMMTTGLIRAATDIYYPPFGTIAAAYVAEQGVSPAQIKPYDKTGTNAGRMEALQAFKRPVGAIHLYTAYVLWVLILVHLVAVIRTETIGGGSIIAAMFSGKKYLPAEPEDR
jgi:cytochrome b